MRFPVSHLPPVIPVGVQTESGVEGIGIDVAAWIGKWPDMTFTVWLTRPGETDAYPANDVCMDDTVLIWIPDGFDTAIPGRGKMEVLGLTPDGEQRKLTGDSVTTLIHRTTLATTKESGEATPAWADSVLSAADRAKAEADRAEQIANNLSGGAITGSVRFDMEQTLTEEEKAQARKNIGADVGVNFTTDRTLTLDPETQVLSVNTAKQVEQDNTLPVTSAAVYTEVGNINALLETI